MINKLCSNIRNIRLYCESVAGSHGLLMTELHVLYALQESGTAMNVSALSRSTGIFKANLVPIIRHLREGGYIERVPSQSDRRQIFVRLLPKGSEKVAEIDALLHDADPNGAADAAIDSLRMFLENQK